jgi:hypothetical protein
MESSGEDIKPIYFTDDINNWYHVLVLPVADTLGTKFNFSNTVTGVLRYSLNTAFEISTGNPWTRIDISHSDATTKVIVDGASFKITVTANNFNGMFIAGNENNNTYATELINFNFESTAPNITTLLARTNDYLLIDNCKAIVNSNINSDGGVFACYNTTVVKKITLTNSYVKLNGNILDICGGTLIGAFRSGGSAEIDCCYSIVNGNLNQYTGGFVGNGLGYDTNQTIKITNCFCIFSGSILNINASVFLGAQSPGQGGNLILNNNLIIANIVNTNNIGCFAGPGFIYGSIDSITGSKNYILDLQGSRTNQVSPYSNINGIWTKYTNHATFISQVNINLRKSTDKFTILPSIMSIVSEIILFFSNQVFRFLLIL